MADTLPIGLQTGFDPSVEYSFRADTQARLNRILPTEGAPSIKYPEFQMPQGQQPYNPSPADLATGNSPFNLKDAYFSDDAAQRQLADEILSKELSKDKAYVLGVNTPEFYDYTKSMNKYLMQDSGYDVARSQAENEDFFAQQQTALGNLTKGLGRLVGSSALKLGQGLGYIGSMLTSIGDSNYLASVADNGFSRYLEEAEETFKNEYLPIYHTLDYDNKGIFSKMLDSSWWAESAADGAAFLLSAAVPGGLLGRLGTGVKYAAGARKLLGLVGADTWGGATAFAVNTASEAFFEAHSSMKSYIEDQKQQRLEGRIFKTDAQIEEEAGKIAKNTFAGNLAVLAVPNAIQNSMIFRKLNSGSKIPNKNELLLFKDNLEVNDVLRTPKNRFEKIANFHKTARLPFYGKIAGVSLASEGLWEENIQLAISRVNAQDPNLSFSGMFKEAMNQYVNQTTAALRGEDSEVAESIVLGGIIGTFGAGAVSKFTKERRKLKNVYSEAQKVADQINRARKTWLNLNDIYETDTNGNVVFENNEPVIKEGTLEAKVAAMEAFANAQQVIEKIDNPELKQMASRDLFKDFIVANIESGTYDKLIEKLSSFNTQGDEVIRGYGFDPQSVKTQPSDLKNYAEEVKNIYEKAQSLENIDPVIKDRIFDRWMQNKNLFEYKGNLYQEGLDLKGQIRTVENGSLADAYADKHNYFEFRIKALEQVDSVRPSQFNKNQIKELKDLQKKLEDDNLENMEGLTMRPDNTLVNEKHISSPSYIDYQYNQKKIAEIDNVVAENEEYVLELLTPGRRKSMLEQEAQEAIKSSPILNPVATEAAEVAPITAVTPEEYTDIVATGNVPEEVKDKLAEKVANDQPLTETETEVYNKVSEEVAPKAARKKREKTENVVVQTPTEEISPTSPRLPGVPIPPLEKVNYDYKIGKVAYLTPLKTTTQDVDIVEGEEIMRDDPYQNFVQDYLTTKLYEDVGLYPNTGKYKMFYMRDRAEWTYNKSVDYDGDLGAVIVITDQQGNPVYFDQNFKETTPDKGRVISYSADTAYINKEITKKAEVGQKKGVLINGQLVALKDVDTVRKSYIAINNDLISRRNRIVDTDGTQELVLTTVQANNGIPVGKVRNAQEVFGDNPKMEMKNGRVLMDIKGQKFFVEPVRIKNTSIANDLIGLYGITYESAQVGEAVIQYMKNVLPTSVRSFSEFNLVDGKIQIKYSGKVLTPQEFKNVVNKDRNPFAMKVMNTDLDNTFTQYVFQNGKPKKVQSSYREFLKDKFLTDLVGTKTKSGEYSFRSPNAYFTFEFADSVGKTIGSDLVNSVEEVVNTVVTDTPTETVVAQTKKEQPKTDPKSPTKKATRNAPVSQVKEEKPILDLTPEGIAANPNVQIVAVAPPVTPSVPEVVAPEAPTQQEVPQPKIVSKRRQIKPATVSEVKEIPVVVNRVKPVEKPKFGIDKSLARTITNDKGYVIITTQFYVDPDVYTLSINPGPVRDALDLLMRQNAIALNNKLKAGEITKEQYVNSTKVLDLRGLSPEEIIDRATPKASLVGERAVPYLENDPAYVRGRDAFFNFEYELEENPNYPSNTENDPELKRVVYDLFQSTGFLRDPQTGEYLYSNEPASISFEDFNLETIRKNSIMNVVSRDSGTVVVDDILQNIYALQASAKKLLGTDVEVITDPEVIDQIKNENAEFFNREGTTVRGFYSPMDNAIYIDLRTASSTTALHEFTHLWNSIIKTANPEFYNKGLELVEGTPYEAEVRELYGYEERDRILEEALTRAVEDKGAKIQKDSGLIAWLKDLWKWIGDKLGLNLSSDEIQNLTLNQYTDLVAGSLLFSEEVSPNIRVQDLKVKKSPDYETEGTWEIRKGDELLGKMYYDRSLYNAWFFTDNNGIESQVGYNRKEALEEIVYMLNNDYFKSLEGAEKQELEAELDTLIPTIQNDVYKAMYRADKEATVRFIAFQANSSESERQGAINGFGERIVQIAQELYPNERPISEIHLSLVKDQMQENMEDLNDEDIPQEESEQTKRKRTSAFEAIEEIVEKNNLYDKISEKLTDLYTAAEALESNSDKIKANKGRILNSLKNIRDRKSQIRTLINTISTANKLLEDMALDFSKALKNADRNERLLFAFNVYNSSKSFEDIIDLIQEIRADLAVYEGGNLNKNYGEIEALLNSGVSYYNTIQKGFIDYLLPDVATILGEKADLYKDVQVKKDAIQAKIKSLEESKSKSPLRTIASIDKQIAKEKERLAALPSKENFESALKGNAEDINSLVYSVVSRADSTSTLVQAVQSIAAEANFRTNQQSQQKANDVFKIFDKFKNLLGWNKANPEENYKAIIRQVELTDDFDSEGKAITHKQDILLNEASPEFFRDRDRLFKRVNDLGRKLGAEKDEVKKRDLRREREKAQLELNDFILNFTDTKLPQEHFEIEKLLKEDLGNGQSLNEYTSGLYEQLTRNAESIGKTAAPSVVKETANSSAYLQRKLDDYLAGLNAPQDSIEYKAAERLQKAIQLRDSIGSYSLSETALDSFQGTLNWHLKNHNKASADQDAIFKFLMKGANLDNEVHQEAIEKLFEGNDLDNYLILNSQLDMYKDSSGMVNGNRVQDTSLIKTLSTDVIEALKKADVTAFRVVNTPYYQETLSNKVNELVEQIKGEYNSEELARLAANDRIKETQWYKDNHVEGIPILSWSTIFINDVEVLKNFQPSTAYYSYSLFEQYKAKGRTENNGKPYINTNPDNKYRDKEYDRMKSSKDPKDQAYFEFLTWYTEEYFKSQEAYGPTSRNGYLLPSVYKPKVERASDFWRNPVAGVQRVIGDITMSEQEKEEAYGRFEQDGKVVFGKGNKIPVRLSARIDTKDQSKDLIGNLLSYNHFAVRYQNLKEIEPLLVSVKDMIEANGTINTNYTKAGVWNAITNSIAALRGKKLEDSKEEKAGTKKQGTSNIEKQLDLVLKEELYGSLNDEFTIPFMGGIDGNNLAKNVMSLSSFGSFVGNLYSPLKNSVGGRIQSLIFARGIKAGVYTFPDTVKAKATFLQNQGNFAQDYTKFGEKSLLSQIFDKLELLQGEVKDEFGKKTQMDSLSSVKDVSFLTFFKNFAEFQIQAEQALAFLHAKKVKQGDKMISLLDAYELDENKNIKLKEGVEFTPQDEFGFSQKVQFYQRMMNGAYKVSERNAVQRNPIGKLLFFMNQYFVPMFSARFRPEYYNIQKGENQEGFYYGTMRNLKEALVDYRFNLKNKWNDMNQEEKASAYQTAKELAIVISLSALASLLGYDDPDRKRKNSSLENYGLALVTGSYAEARSFISPSDYYNKINNPFFAFRPISTSIKLLEDTWSYAAGSPDAVFNRDNGFWEKGDVKAVADVLKLFGVTGGQFGLSPFLSDERGEKIAETFAKNVELALKLRN